MDKIANGNSKLVRLHFAGLNPPGMDVNGIAGPEPPDVPTDDCGVQGGFLVSSGRGRTVPLSPEVLLLPNVTAQFVHSSSTIGGPIPSFIGESFRPGVVGGCVP